MGGDDEYFTGFKGFHRVSPVIDHKDLCFFQGLTDQNLPWLILLGDQPDGVYRCLGLSIDIGQGRGGEKFFQEGYFMLSNRLSAQDNEAEVPKGFGTGEGSGEVTV